MKSSYKGVTLVEGGHIYSEGKLTPSAVKPADRLKTIAYSILSSHNESHITEDTSVLTRWHRTTLHTSASFRRHARAV